MNPMENTPKSTRSNPDNHFNAGKLWDSEYGEKLFDVLNRDRILEAVKSGFDNQFYEDQCGPRYLIMQIRKVTDEYKTYEVQRLQTEARKYAREMMARGLDVT